MKIGDKVRIIKATSGLYNSIGSLCKICDDGLVEVKVLTLNGRHTITGVFSEEHLELVE